MMAYPVTRSRSIVAVLLLVVVTQISILSAFEPQQLPLPTKQGNTFVVDDFNNKVTLSDLGFNYFSGNQGTSDLVSGATTMTLSPDSHGGEGGSLEIAFQFSQSGEFGGFFSSLFGLTDTLVSLDGSGQQPADPTSFPDYFLDFFDFYGPNRAFPDQSIDALAFDLKITDGTQLVLKVELTDESGARVFRRKTLTGNAWQELTFAVPVDFDQGDIGSFNWRKVSVLALIVEENQPLNPSQGRFLVDNIRLIDYDGDYVDLDSPQLNKENINPSYEHAFLDYVRATSAQFFLDFKSTDPRTGGMIQDRSSFADLMSLGGVGFQLTTYVVQAARGYITREEAAEKTRALLAVLHGAPQGPERVGTLGYRGFFYHFAGIDGLRKQNFDFLATTELDESRNTVELSSIDTALAIAGVVTAGRFFDGFSTLETEIRNLAQAIYARVDWPFMLHGGTQQFYLGWKPNENRDDESGRFGRFLLDDVDGLGQYASKPDGKGGEAPATIDFFTDEGLLLAILAMGAPDPAYRLDASAWFGMLRQDDGGHLVKTFPGALFTYQFAAVWLDTHSLGTDTHPSRPVNFFENSRNAVETVLTYTQSNPNNRATWQNGGGSIHWGLSACEGPFDDYHAHAAPPVALASDGGYIEGPGDVQLEAEEGTGDGVMKPRGNASAEKTILLHDGESRTLSTRLPMNTDYEVMVRYSNDHADGQPLENVVVTLDSQFFASFQPLDTGSSGQGWNNFETHSFGFTKLSEGDHTWNFEVSGGDGYGVELDVLSLRILPILRPLEEGTTTVYGAGSAILFKPQESIQALWGAARLGLLHPRVGFADAYNLEIADVIPKQPNPLRTSGPWANFIGFGIDHGPMTIMIDNYLHDNFIPKLFTSHPTISQALYAIFPDWCACDLESSFSNQFIHWPDQIQMQEIVQSLHLACSHRLGQ